MLLNILFASAAEARTRVLTRERLGMSVSLRKIRKKLRKRADKETKALIKAIGKKGFKELMSNAAKDLQDWFVLHLAKEFQKESENEMQKH